jgi:hypothetical protein
MAVDRMAPMLLNTAEGGTTWREYGITATASSPATARTSSPRCPPCGRRR